MRALGGSGLVLGTPLGRVLLVATSSSILSGMSQTRLVDCFFHDPYLSRD